MSNEYLLFVDRFKSSCSGLDEQLELFLNRVFSTEGYVSNSFYSLVESLKRLDGNFLRDCAKALSEEKLSAMVSQLCQNNNARSKYKFSDQVISYRLEERTSDFRDAKETIALSRFREMSDLEFLSYLNGYDLPHLGTSIIRSAYEHFFGNLIKELKSDVNKQDLRFELFEQSFQYLGWSITSVVKILYMITNIFSDIFRLACQSMGQTLPDEYPLSGKIRFFDSFVAAREKFVEAHQMPADDVADAWRNFVNIDFLCLTKGEGGVRNELSELGRLDLTISKLDTLVAADHVAVDQGRLFFQKMKIREDISADCLAFCDKSIAFLSGHLTFVDELSRKDGLYRVALDRCRALLSRVCQDYQYESSRPASESTTPRSSNSSPRVSPSPRGEVLAPRQRDTSRVRLRASSGADGSANRSAALTAMFRKSDSMNSMKDYLAVGQDTRKSPLQNRRKSSSGGK